MAHPLAGRPPGGRAGDRTVIHQNVIKRRADEDGLSASAVERDYVLAHSLTAISECDREQRLVFKVPSHAS